MLHDHFHIIGQCTGNNAPLCHLPVAIFVVRDRMISFIGEHVPCSRNCAGRIGNMRSNHLPVNKYGISDHSNRHYHIVYRKMLNDQRIGYSQHKHRNAMPDLSLWHVLLKDRIDIRNKDHR